jgi:hypothetical protein
VKRLLSSAAAAVWLQAITVFAGSTEVSPKNVVAPSPVALPSSYFRANEWDLGAFATYDKSFDGNRKGIGEHAWGGGVGVSYFPWLYAGFRIEGSVVNTIPGDNTSGQVDGDFILRYPLDLVNPNLHLAPYAYAGVGGLFSESGGFGRFVTATAKFESSRKDNRVLGDFGGGLEYRFTPHIGIFSEVGYNVVEGPRNNFMQVNFGAKFAF